LQKTYGGKLTVLSAITEAVADQQPGLKVAEK
jgi:hypothetical protein